MNTTPLRKLLAGIALAQAAALSLTPAAMAASSTDAFQSVLSAGERYLLQQDNNRAAVTLWAAVAIDPARPEPYLTLMELYAQQHDSDNALKVLSQALQQADLSEEQISHLAALYTAACQEEEDVEDSDEEAVETPEIIELPPLEEEEEAEPESKPKHSLLTSFLQQVASIVGGKTETVPVVEEAGHGQSVSFSNPQLESALRRAAGRDNGDLLESDLERITEIDLTSCNISDLSFLQYLPNLEVLNLSHNKIRYLSGISILSNLRELNLNYNQITNLRPIAKMESLTALFLVENNISDLRPLSNLTNLYTLFLAGNQITDLSPLKTLTLLEDVDLEDNEISDWSPVAFVNSVRGRPATTDSSDTASSSVVEEEDEEEEENEEDSSIGIEISEVWDLKPEDGNKGGDERHRSEFEIRRAIQQSLGLSRPLSMDDLSQVSELDLSNLGISDLSPLSGCVNLKVLRLNGNQIVDLKPLVGLRKLTLLDLSNNQIQDISPLACKDFPALMTLILDNNQISNLSVFTGHLSFTRLSLKNNPISDWTTTYHLRNVDGRPAISSLYQLVIGKYTWEQAEEVCEAAGGHLAVISSPEENELVAKFLSQRGYQSAYIGLKALPARNGWNWEDSSPAARRRSRPNPPMQGPLMLVWNWVTGDSFTEGPWASGEPKASDSALFAIACSDQTWSTGVPDGGTAVFLCEIDLARSTSDYSGSPIEVSIVGSN